MNQTNDSLNKKITLIISAMGSFLIPFIGSSIIVALPSIGSEYSLNAVMLGWVATSYLVATAIILIPVGKIADIYGRKRVFIYGLYIFAFASIACAVSGSAAGLIIARVLQGVGGAMIFATSVAILTSVFPAHERGKALGINIAAVYIGLSIGPFVGGFLTQNFGWRSIFWVNAPLGLITALVVTFKLTGEWTEAKGESFDWAGSLIYGVSLAALMYGFSRLPGFYGFILCVAGAIGLISFIIFETRVETPVLNIGLFRGNTVFTFSNIAALINYCATAAVAFYLSLYLQYIKALTPVGAGAILIAQPVVMALFSPFAGRMSDKIEPRILASIGMALTAAGLFFLVFIGEQTPLISIILILILIGAGFALFSSPNTNAVMSSVEKKFYGVASATLGTMRIIGHMLSWGISMLILAVYIGNNRIAPENYPLFITSMKTAFLIFSGLCFAGIYASFTRGKINRKGI